MVHPISFQTFFVQAFKIVVDYWKFSILLLYILWDDWPIFMISASNQQLWVETIQTTALLRSARIQRRVLETWGNFPSLSPQWKTTSLRWCENFSKEKNSNNAKGVLRVAFNKFPDFFVQAFKIIVDSWKFSILLLYILWDDWPTFMISRSNEQLQQELEYNLLKPDCHSWWISKMQSGREDTLEERYAIKLCFKLGKMPQKRMECFRLLFDHLAWIKHQFLSGIRDSRKPGSLWGMMRGVGGVRKSIHQSWLAKMVRVSVRVTMLRF